MDVEVVDDAGSNDTRGVNSLTLMHTVTASITQYVCLSPLTCEHHVSVAVTVGEREGCFVLRKQQSASLSHACRHGGLQVRKSYPRLICGWINLYQTATHFRGSTYKWGDSYMSIKNIICLQHLDISSWMPGILKSKRGSTYT